MDKSDFFAPLNEIESETFTYFNYLIKRYENYNQDLKEELRKEVIQEIDKLRIKLSTPDDLIRREDIFPQIYKKDELEWLIDEDTT